MNPLRGRDQKMPKIEFDGIEIEKGFDHQIEYTNQRYGQLTKRAKLTLSREQIGPKVTEDISKAAKSESGLDGWITKEGEDPVRMKAFYLGEDSQRLTLDVHHG